VSENEDVKTWVTAEGRAQWRWFVTALVGVAGQFLGALSGRWWLLPVPFAVVALSYARIVGLVRRPW
jgi:hypothetical protein